MFTIEKASPRSEDYLLDPVEYYLRSRRRKKRKRIAGEPYDDDSPDDGPDDEPGFGDADPYTIDMPGEPPGRWFPSFAAAFLLLIGMVLEVPYRRVFRGFHPHTQRPLVQNAGMPNRRPGWECCLSAPKDVSVLWSQLSPADRERLQLCNWLAAEETIKWIEENFVFSRVGKAKEGCQYVPVSLVAPMFEHASSRALDPDLHIHFQLLNLGVDKDGNVRTIDPILIFKNQKLITAYYRAALASALRDEFGLTIEVHGHTFRIRGVPQELVKAQSKRSQQILDHMAKKGQSGGAAAHRAALETRPQKDPYISREELFRKWRAENARFRFDDAYVAKLIRPKPPARTRRLAPTGDAAMHGREPVTNSTASGRQPRRYSPRTCKKLIKRAIRRATRQRNHFSEQELLLYTLYKLPAFGVSPAQVPAEVRNYLRKNPDVVPLGSHDGEQRFTTKQILQEEARMLTALERTSKRSGRRVSDKNLNREIKKRPTLKQEQIEFIRHLTQSKSAFRIGLGYAGVGKTYTLKTAVDACHRQGLRVIGVAPTGKAAEVLAAEAGIPCQTLTKFLADYRLPFSAVIKHHLRQLWRAARHRKTWRFRQPRPKQLTSRDIVLVDEAGMISTT